MIELKTANLDEVFKELVLHKASEAQYSFRCISCNTEQVHTAIALSDVFCEGCVALGLKDCSEI